MSFSVGQRNAPSLPRLDAVRRPFQISSPEGYGTKKSSDRPRNISPALSQRIWQAVHEDTGRSFTQIKALTDADCSPITIRRHLRDKGLNNKKCLSKTTSPLTPQTCPFGLCKGATNMGHWKVEEKRKRKTWTVLMVSSWCPTLLAWQGAPTGEVFYAAQWRRLHRDQGCIFLQWNNGASACAGVSNGSWLRGDVAAGTPLAAQNVCLTKDSFQENSVALMDHPACSPDLNPIEEVWRWMVREVFKKWRQFETLDALREASLPHWALRMVGLLTTESFLVFWGLWS